MSSAPQTPLLQKLMLEIGGVHHLFTDASVPHRILRDDNSAVVHALKILQLVIVGTGIQFHKHLRAVIRFAWEFTF